MRKLFFRRFLIFVGIMVPGTFAFALLMAPPAHPEPLQPPGCDRSLADATANVAAGQARVKKLGMTSGPETCSATQLYFLEVVKARAVAALCKSGAERQRELGRLDADVEHINGAIAGPVSDAKIPKVGSTASSKFHGKRNRCTTGWRQASPQNRHRVEFSVMKANALCAWLTTGALAFAAWPAIGQDAPPSDSNNVVLVPETTLTTEESAMLGIALVFDPLALAEPRKKPLRDPSDNGYAVTRSDKPDGSSTFVVMQPLPTDWSNSIGADLVARARRKCL